MSKNKIAGRPRVTARIYYGQHPDSGERMYWTVRVKDAREPVRVNGTVLDAIQGQPGVVVGCHLSQCAMRNANQFPHPCKLAAFTKATALIVTKISNGRPTEAVRYNHSYGQIVDLNDTDINKKYVRTHRDQVDRTFILRPVASRRPASRDRSPAKKSWKRNGSKSARVPRGALARALKAGLINQGVFNTLAPWDPSEL